MRIGIIGTGVMGADHARTLGTHVPGVVLRAVYDADAGRARTIANETGAETVAQSPQALIEDGSVDAVLIASPDQTHKELVLACLAARKPVLCEKPLAPTPAECLDVIAAEKRLGKRLVQVGYMRRFDPAYVEMKRVRPASLGEALMLHCVHGTFGPHGSMPGWRSPIPPCTNSISRAGCSTRSWPASRRSCQAAAPSSAGSPVFLVLATGGVSWSRSRSSSMPAMATMSVASCLRKGHGILAPAGPIEQTRPVARQRLSGRLAATLRRCLSAADPGLGPVDREAKAPAPAPGTAMRRAPSPKPASVAGGRPPGQDRVRPKASALCDLGQVKTN